MEPDIDSQIRGLDLTVTYRARVVNNVDPKMEGRLGVFIPSLVTEYPQDMQTPGPMDHPIRKEIFQNAKELDVRTTVREDNYIWARPSSWLVDNGESSSNYGGTFRVPRNGTVVELYFEGADPNRPYWRAATPTVDGDVIAGSNIGAGTNVGASAANWTDPAKRVNINVLAEHDSGNVVYIDDNANSNCFVIRWANGHTLSIHHAQESGIVLQTQKGHLVQLDENSGEIRIKSQTGQSTITIADSGQITVKSSAQITMKSPKINLN